MALKRKFLTPPRSRPSVNLQSFANPSARAQKGALDFKLVGLGEFDRRKSLGFFDPLGKLRVCVCKSGYTHIYIYIYIYIDIHTLGGRVSILGFPCTRWRKAARGGTRNLPWTGCSFERLRMLPVHIRNASHRLPATTGTFLPKSRGFFVTNKSKLNYFNSWFQVL